MPAGWEHRALDNADGALAGMSGLGGVLERSAAGPYVYLHHASGEVRLALPEPDEHGEVVPTGPFLAAGTQKHMTAAAAAYSASSNHTRDLAYGAKKTEHQRLMQAGDPVACAVHPGEMNRRMLDMDPDQTNLNALHALGHQLHALATQADGVFSRLEAEVESTVDRVRSTRERVSRLHGFGPYIAQLWSAVPEPLLLYEQPPQPPREPPVEHLSAELPTENFFGAGSLPPALAARRQQLVPNPIFEAISPWVAPTFGRNKLAVLDSQGVFICGQQFYANPEIFNHHFYQQMMTEGKAARAERKKRRMARKEQRKRILRKIRLMMQLGKGTLSREVEEVLQQDMRRASLNTARKNGVPGGTEYTINLPSNVEDPGIGFITMPAGSPTALKTTPPLTLPPNPWRARG